MSRHPLPSTDKYSEIIVGWDNPMRTYFAQLYLKDEPVDDYDTPHDAIGQQYAQVPNVFELVVWMGDRGIDFPTDVVERLAQDRENAQPRTPLQRQMETLLTGQTPPPEILDR